MAVHGRGFQPGERVQLRWYRLVGAPGPQILSWSFDPATSYYRLSWQSKAGKLYTILYTRDLGEGFTPLASDIYAESTETSYEGFLPSESSGYLRILQQP